MNEKIVLATATGVKADETNVQGTATSGNGASTVTTAGAGKTGTSQNAGTQSNQQPIVEDSDEETGSTSNDNQ